TTMISHPDIFAALGLIGFTVAAPFSSNGKLAGVAAADITLDDLGAYLAQRKVSPGTLSYILDSQGRVIAASDLSKTYANVDGKLELLHITSLDKELPAIAFSARPRGSEGQFTFTFDGNDYVASLASLAPEFGGHSRFLTVFFSDLEGFSTLSEEVPSQELLLRVSAYLELVTKMVNQEHGTIDKFIGDGVMAFWGAPALLDDHAWRSCVAALRIEQGMTLLNERWVAEGHKPLNVRIGLNSDAVLVGNIGSKERMGYTVIGA